MVEGEAHVDDVADGDGVVEDDWAGDDGFEREDGGGFKPQSSYPELALASVNTHDMPTIAGFWAGRYIELRRTLGLIDEIAITGDLENYHLLHAARADLRCRVGMAKEAARSYEDALALVTTESERRFLERRLHEVQAAKR